MRFELLVRDVFPLKDGLTVLACEGKTWGQPLAGKKCLLISNGQVRQTVVLAGERFLLNKSSSQRALETNDLLAITGDEIRNGDWRLVCDTQGSS